MLVSANQYAQKHLHSSVSTYMAVLAATNTGFQAILLVEAMSAPLCTMVWGSTTHGKWMQMLGQFCSAPRYFMLTLFACLHFCMSPNNSKVKRWSQQSSEKGSFAAAAVYLLILARVHDNKQVRKDNAQSQQSDTPSLRGDYLQARNSRIELPAVRYGRQGPWAINLWFKPSNEAGNQFQYLFSHNSTEFSDYTGHQYSPNQVWTNSRSEQIYTSPCLWQTWKYVVLLQLACRNTSVVMTDTHCLCLCLDHSLC